MMKTIKIIAIISLLTTLISSCGSSNEAKDLEQMTAADFMLKGDEEFANGAYKKAISSYESILTRFPASDLQLDAQIKISACYGETDQFENQTELLLRLLKENIIPNKIPQVYIQIGQFYERAANFNPGVVTDDTTDYKKAIDYYTKAYEYTDSEDSDAKSHAVYRRALTKAKIGKIEEALNDYQLITANFPRTSHNILALIKLENPSDLSELKTDDASLATYKERLGITQELENTTQEMEEAPEDQPSPAENTLDESLFEADNLSNDFDDELPVLTPDSLDSGEYDVPDEEQLTTPETNEESPEAAEMPGIFQMDESLTPEENLQEDTPADSVSTF
jgi:tetratricopeptide (TPR) repeat protein